MNSCILGFKEEWGGVHNHYTSPYNSIWLKHFFPEERSLLINSWAICQNVALINRNEALAHSQ